MQIEMDNGSGFCFGVTTAIKSRGRTGKGCQTVLFG